MDESLQISVDVLRQLVRLDTLTGRLYWLPRGPEWFNEGKYSAERTSKRWNTRYAGKEALTSKVVGYRAGRILETFVYAHCAVFALHHGRWAAGTVDHVDLDRANNLPSNLREATRQQNQQNIGSKGGTSQYCGVDRIGAKWRARCTDGARIPRHLGVFDDEIDAAHAYDAAALRWHGEFARLNFPA